MVTQLRVVNDCLAIMGETPLNTLQEDHEYKAAALTRLAAENSRIQSKGGAGWWFNTEDVTLQTNPADNRIYLPGDTLSIIVFDKRPNLAQRGRVLYSLSDGTDVFPAGTQYEARLIREVEYELVPTSVAEYIAASVVLAFQNEYDGDSTKTRDLGRAVVMRHADAMSEHIRNRKVNLLNNSYGLARIRRTVRQGARY